jgi:integrase
MSLTDTACKNATCPPEKARARFSDSGGLYLEVAPNGSKRWFWKYLFDGKEKRLALGSYPDVTLKAARGARDDARKLQQAGTDPVQQRRVDKLMRSMDSAQTFEAVSREFYEVKKSSWSPLYAKRWMERLEKDLFPWIGSLPLGKISTPLLLQTLRRVEGRGANETAHTLRKNAGQVFRYGAQAGLCERNPAIDLHGALAPVAVKHMAAVLEPLQAGELMRAIHDYAGQTTTRAALILSAYLFQRPGNIRQMEWAWINEDAAMLTIPSMDMKRRLAEKANGRPHLVPLAPQALNVLNDLKPLTGHGRYVFPSLLTGERPMSDNTVNTALRRLGYSKDEMSAHGFRAMARTIMAEKLNMPADVIEAQLAHKKSGPLGAAYDRAEYLAQRRAMMNAWADYLESLRVGAKVIPFKAA